MYRIYVEHQRFNDRFFRKYKWFRQFGMSVENATNFATGDTPGEIYANHQNEYSARGGVTLVTLQNEDEDLSFYGSAYCSPEDSYNKRVGIKLALKRAIVSSGLEYDDWMPLAVTYGADYVADVWRAIAESPCSMPF